MDGVRDPFPALCGFGELSEALSKSRCKFITTSCVGGSAADDSVEDWVEPDELSSSDMVEALAVEVEAWELASGSSGGSGDGGDGSSASAAVGSSTGDGWSDDWLDGWSGGWLGGWSDDWSDDWSGGWSDGWSDGLSD